MSNAKKVIPMSDSSDQIAPEDLAPTILPDAFHSSEIAHAFLNFTMPRYRELPAMPLYRDQVVAYVENVLQPLDACVEGSWLSPSMINNYVKMKLVPAPEKKQYGRNHIAKLIAVCLFKQVLPMAAVESMFRIQQVSYNATELESALRAAFMLKQENVPDSAQRITRESLLVRSAITAFVSKAYLLGYLRYTEL